MTSEEESPILLDKDTILRINRVPRNVKKDFVELANLEYEGDYGMLLRWIWEQAMEYQQMKFSLFNGLLYPHEQKPALQEEKKSKRFLSGRRIEMKGGREE